MVAHAFNPSILEGNIGRFQKTEAGYGALFFNPSSWEVEAGWI